MTHLLPGLPARVADVCGTHLTLLDAAVPGLVTGLHLHGSLAVSGELFEGSDIDFVAVATRLPTDADVEALRALHSQLGRLHEGTDYDGFYVTETQLAGPPSEVTGAPGALHGWFSTDVHGDVNLVTWHELAGFPLTVWGKDIREVAVHTDDAALARFTRENLDTYWRAQLEAMPHHPREAGLPQATEWGALGMPRLLHLLETGRLTSKSGAGRWALERFPQHHRVIEEALRVRERPDESSAYDDSVPTGAQRRAADLTALMADVLLAAGLRPAGLRPGTASPPS